MHFENFTERDIPYETLANYGLTHEMVDDLPESVMTTVIHRFYLLELRLKLRISNSCQESRCSLV